MSTIEPDTAARAEKHVLGQLHMWAERERVIARELGPRVFPADIEMHLAAADLYEALIKRAPEIWADTARLRQLAENTKEEA